MLGVEPDARLASFARRTGVKVEVAPFEAWDPAGRELNAVVAGHAWHFVHPVAGAVRAARVLRPGGRLVAFWHLGEPPREVAEAFAAAWHRVVPGSPVNFRARPGQADRNAAAFTVNSAAGIREAGGFSHPEQWRYDWERTCTRDEAGGTARFWCLHPAPAGQARGGAGGYRGRHRRAGRQRHHELRNGGRYRGADQPRLARDR